MKKETAPANILGAMESIVESAEKSKLSNSFLKKNAPAISYLTNRLQLAPMQVVFLSLFVDQSEERNISLSKIAQYLGCRTTRILSMMEDLEALEKMRYIRIINGHNSQSYRVPKDVVKALSHNHPYSYKPMAVNDLASFFEGFSKLMGEKEDDELRYEALMQHTFEMLEEIPSSSLVRGLKRHKLVADDKLLFIYMAHLYVKDCNEDISLYEIENLYDNDEIPFWCRQELRNRDSELMECKLIENAFEEGMARSDSFRLTEKAKYELLADLNLKDLGKTAKGLIKHSELTKKRLFFNQSEISRIKELQAILSPRKYNKVVSDLAKAGMRKGICCLLYGPPGTGKTETAYQIARETGRDIMQVDVEKIKSCWVGETEKNIKQIFERYQAVCKNAVKAPILLFNEADAILGIRMEGAAKAVDRMENSVQNIILQEMEKLEGIMIATTNLTANLDNAFQRRFLYKIKYERPDATTRGKIWKSMIPGLKKAEALYLAEQFNLSGGEIENIARRQTVNVVLSNNHEIDLAYLERLSREEQTLKTTNPRIGF